MRIFVTEPVVPSIPQNFWPARYNAFRPKPMLSMLRSRRRKFHQPGQRPGPMPIKPLLNLLNFGLSSRKKALSTRIATFKFSFEATDRGPPKSRATSCYRHATAIGTESSVELDALEAQQKSIQANLEVATRKLAAARLGETLERDQQSEKLEVLDQPTQPQEPIRPNRPKIAGIAAVLALMLGGGIALAAELFDRAIRRSSDLYGVVDRDLIISIPYIYTHNEVQRRRKKAWMIATTCIVVLVVGLAFAYWFLPPLDLLVAKARVGLFR